jgi:hypothetical protein
MLVILRLLSLVLVVAALMILGGDITTSLERGGEITVRSFNEVWELFSKTGPQGLKVWADHALPGPLSNWLQVVLALPAGFVTGVTGVVLAFLFGRRSGP